MSRIFLFVFCATIAYAAYEQKNSVGNAPVKRPNAMNCLVGHVIDGDTVKVQCSDGQAGNARLMGFDTPETYRSGCDAEYALGKQATYYLEQRLRNATIITPQTHGRDKYDRLLMELTLDGEPLDQIMVQAGLAVPYEGGKRINWCDRLS